MSAKNRVSSDIFLIPRRPGKLLFLCALLRALRTPGFAPAFGSFSFPALGIASPGPQE